DARYYIKRWRTGAVTLTPARLDGIQANLARSVAYDPANPNYQEDLARFLTWRNAVATLLAPAARRDRTRARELFTQAAVRRPTSERAWSSVAAIRFILGEVDTDFSTALRLALRQGPWNPEIQMNAIRIGLASWDVLPSDLKTTLRKAIHHQAHWALAPQKDTLATFVKGYRRGELLCLLDPGPKGCSPN
ncbi:MAG: hypothetical protein K9J74_13045, partial [Sulfuritalea sp.]|nr:hypothetical protein [Sulfuritalea sp.]